MPRVGRRIQLHRVLARALLAFVGVGSLPLPAASAFSWESLRPSLSLPSSNPWMRDAGATPGAEARRLQLGFGGQGVGGVQAQWLCLVGQDPSRTAQRFALKVSGKRLSLEGLFQESDARLAGDRTLSTADRALIGNGWGGRRQSLTGGYSLGSAGALGASWLRLGDAKGTLSRQRLSWQGAKNAHLSLDWGRADAGFGRLAELPEAERGDVKGRQGRRWQDLSARFSPTRWLVTEQLWSRWHALQGDSGQERARGQWTLLPARGTTIHWLRDATTTRSGKQASTTTLSALQWDQTLPTLKLHWGRSVTANQAAGRTARSVAQNLRLEQTLAPFSWSAALDTTRTGEREQTRRLALRLQLPATPAKPKATPPPLAGIVEVTATRALGDREERVAKLDLTTRLPIVAALKLDGKWNSAGREKSEQWKLEARGALGARLPWSGALAQTRSDRGGGRRDLTLTLSPTAPAAGSSRPRLSASLARSEAIAPRGDDDRSPPPAHALGLLGERTVGKMAVAAGLAHVEAGGEQRLSLAYDLRSDPQRAFQWELSHRLVEAGKAASPLLRREAIRVRPEGGWELSLARERLTIPTENGLADGEARLVAEVARKTRGWQWSAGASHQMAGDGRRDGLATRFSLQGAPRVGGALKLSYEEYPALPGPDGLRERVTAAYQHRMKDHLTLDFQGAWQRRHGKPRSEPVWRVDMSASF